MISAYPEAVVSDEVPATGYNSSVRLLPPSTMRHLSSSDASVSEALIRVTAESCAISGELPASKNCSSVRLTSTRGISDQFEPGWKVYAIPRCPCHSGVNGNRLLSVAVAVGVTGPKGGGGVMLSNLVSR